MVFDIEYTNKDVAFRFDLKGKSLGVERQVSMTNCRMKSGGHGWYIAAQNVDILLTSLWVVKKEVEQKGGAFDLPRDMIMRVLRKCVLDKCISPPKAVAIFNRLFS